MQIISASFNLWEVLSLGFRTLDCAFYHQLPSFVDMELTGQKVEWNLVQLMFLRWKCCSIKTFRRTPQYSRTQPELEFLSPGGTVTGGCHRCCWEIDKTAGSGFPVGSAAPGAAWQADNLTSSDCHQVVASALQCSQPVWWWLLGRRVGLSSPEYIHRNANSTEKLSLHWW